MPVRRERQNGRTQDEGNIPSWRSLPEMESGHAEVTTNSIPEVFLVSASGAAPAWTKGRNDRNSRN